MATSPAKLAANRANALKSTGPKTDEGKQRSRGNAIVHGMRCETLQAEEDAGPIAGRVAAWNEALGPRDAVEAWLVARAAAASVRLDRCARREAAWLALRERHAAAEWDAAQHNRAAASARLLPTAPAAAVGQLVQTAAGCAWLLAAWAELRDRLDAGPWDAEADARAAALLGQSCAAPEDAEGMGLCLLIEREVADLEDLRAALEPREASLRAEAIARVAFDSSPSGALMQRYESAHAGDLHRCLRALDRPRRPAGDAADLPAPNEPTDPPTGPEAKPEEAAEAEPQKELAEKSASPRRAPTGAAPGVEFGDDEEAGPVGSGGVSPADPPMAMISAPASAAGASIRGLPPLGPSPARSFRP